MAADTAINSHDPLATWDWARNFLTQAASGSESGAIGAGAKHRWQSLDALRALLVEITNVVNNVTTTLPGKVLDARQGKALADTIQAEIAKYAQPNGIATLGSDGKVPAAQIPSLALVDVFPVASEAAMLALDAQQGDMAIRTDSNQVFVLSASPASTLANWVEMSALKALVDAAIADLAGAGRSTETVKGNADAILTKVNLTKMPNGATAVYSQDFLNGVDGWGGYVNVASVQNYANDAMLITPTNPASNYYITRTIFGFTGKRLLIRARVAGGTAYIAVYPTILGSQKKQIFGQLNARNSVFSIDIPVWAGADSSLLCFEIGPSESTYIDWIWIGDYSYIANSLSTEASRIANQLGDTTGIGTKASGTITSNGTNVSDGNTVTIAGKVYTFKTVLGTTEGNVLIGDSAATSLDNLKLAINSTGVTAEQYCAAIHPLVEATTNTDTVQTLQARAVGLLGNSITLAKSAATLTLSSPTLTGGTDDVGQKIYTQVKDIVAGGTRPAQADISDTSTVIGYENSVDVASGGTTTLPAGGTFRWAVYGYGATISSAKKGTSAGGTILTVAGANATVWYRRIA